MHPALDLVLAIVNLQGIAAREIKTIDVLVNRIAREVLSFSLPKPGDSTRRNLPQAVAVAAANGVLVPKDFERPSKQKAVLDLMRRIRCRVDPKLDALGHERARTVVRITLANRRVVEMRTEVAKGTPQKPLSEVEIFHKFFQCALPVFDERHAEAVLNGIWTLEETADVSTLFTPSLPATERSDHAHTHDHAHGHEHHHPHENQRSNRG